MKLFNQAIDMWSFGCILVELYTGYPLFPGESEADQLSLIMEMFGMPSEDLLALSQRKNLFFDPEGNIMIKANSKGKTRKVGVRSFEATIKCQDPLFLDFILKCLVMDPRN
jgi:dual specificity tyrosine-phosphorylation-regulated kinase 2/3/4